ncbi:MAG: DUF370 domain-containing protein [Eubacteriales bacterium]|nr:DUF370 domain-containing protein [Eubacteriales bacterium]
MFLHIGADVEIPLRNIIAICDMDSSTLSKGTREFLKVSEEEGFVKYIGHDIPKTFIITENNGISTVYLTSISSVTLSKRANYLREVKNYVKKKK